MKAEWFNTQTKGSLNPHVDYIGQIRVPDNVAWPEGNDTVAEYEYAE